MAHNHTPNHLTRAERLRQRRKLIRSLAELLWDQTKPDGEEGVPEELWESILQGPCKGNRKLIEEVCTYERYLRKDDEEEGEKYELHIPKEEYVRFIIDFLDCGDVILPVRLLWNFEESDWYPEEQWDEILDKFEDAQQGVKEVVKSQARELRLVRTTESFSYRI